MEDESDPDEAVLAEWAQGELPGAMKPVSNLYLGTVCNCGEKLDCELNFFFFFIIFLKEVSSTATVAVVADEAAADEAEPTAGPSGLCGRRRTGSATTRPVFFRRCGRGV